MIVFISAFFAGIVLPLVCAYFIWRPEPKLRLHLVVFVIILAIQIIGEALLSSNALTHFIKYFSACFVGVRIAHIILMYKLSRLSFFPNKTFRLLFFTTLAANSLVWPIVFIRLINKF